MICPAKPTCSNTEHRDVTATVFCPECGKFMCESCEKFHNGFLSGHHPTTITGIEPGSQIITGKCSVAGHHNVPLEYYCKSHNIPCCVACLCTKEDVGKHSNCETVPLKDMEQHMKSTLGDVIKELEATIGNAEAAMEKLEKARDKNGKAKDDTVNRIKESFNAIREAIDARERELLCLAEELWNKETSCEKLAEIGSKYPESAKRIVASARKIEGHWDTGRLPEMAQHYALAVDTNNELMEFISDVEEVAAADLEIKFQPSDEGITAFIEEVKKFGNVFIKPKFGFKKSPNNKYTLEGPSNTVIRKIGNDNWDCTAIGSTVLPMNSIISWDVKILSTINGAFMMGVAPSDINQNDTNNYSKCGRYFYCCDSTLYSGLPHNYSVKSYGGGRNLKNGDVVGVTMNTSTGELSFSVNGASLGVAYNDIPLDEPLVPAFEFYHKNDCVEITLK